MRDTDPRRGLLAQRLAEACACHQTAEPAMISAVMQAVLETMGDDLSTQDARLLGEVEELSRTIAAAKAEIAALQADDVTASHIPSATDELGAVVAHTAAATEIILETCEALDQMATELVGPAAAALQDATMRIYEACSFQDITGQRITKVVATLRAIDTKVAQILSTFGSNMHARDASISARPDVSGDAALLNGPQLPQAAMDQSEIDRMLADF